MNTVLFEFKRARVQLIVHALLRDELIVRAALDDPAVIEDHDRIRVADGGEPVRDDKHRSALHQSIHALLHKRFRTRIDGGSRFVQDHDGRIGNRRPRNGNQLTLSLRQVGRLVTEHRVVPFGQARDKVVRVGKLCRGDALLVRRIQFSVTDVLHNGARKQVCILQNDAQRTAQVCLFDLIDIDAVVADLAVGDVVEAVQKVGNGRFARARRTDKGDLLTGFCIDGDVVKDNFFGYVSEIHVIQLDIALELGIGDGAVRLVGMAPCPFARTLRAFGDVAVFVDLRIDERDVSFVRFRLLVKKLKDTARARKTHDDRVDLHGHLPDVQRELAGHIQERGDDCARKDAPARHGKVLHLEQDQKPRNDRHQHEGEVTDVHDGRHQNIAVRICLVGRIAEFVVDLVELLFGALFMAEHFDDLLSAHHLFDVPFRLADDRLLTDEVLCTAATHIFGDRCHDRDTDKHDKHQPQAVQKHDDKQHQGRYDGIIHLRDTHGNELTQSVRIVGVRTHDVAVRVRIKIADRQGLHSVEHIGTHVLQKSLRNDGHRLVVKDRRTQGDHVHQSHAADDIKERRAHFFPGSPLDERRDDLFDDQREEHGRADSCRRRDHDADKYGDQADLIIMEQIGKQSSQQLERMDLRATLHGRHLLTHDRHLLPQGHPSPYSANNRLPDRSGWFSEAPRACRRR